MQSPFSNSLDSSSLSPSFFSPIIDWASTSLASINSLTGSTSHTLWWWLALTSLLFFFIDFMQLKKDKDHVMTAKEATVWSVYWLMASFVFLLGFYLISLVSLGPDKASASALLYLTGFIVEKSLAIDNILVFLIVFSTFLISKEKQNIILFYGIVGAIVLRLIMIALGAALVENFAWILTIFAIVLLVMAWKMWPRNDSQPTPLDNSNSIANRIKNYVNINYDATAPHFKKMGKSITISSFLAALIAIAFVDVVFAIDSIPAIFALTTDAYIVTSANVMALLGLRSMYFLLLSVQNKFIYLNHCLAIILAFIGVKLLIAPVFHIPVGLSLGAVLAVLFGGLALSIYKTRHEKLLYSDNK